MTAAGSTLVRPGGSLRRVVSSSDVQLALLGTGAVGTAFLTRLHALQHGATTGVRLVHVANSRRAISSAAGIDARCAQIEVLSANRQSDLDDVVDAFGPRGGIPWLVVDATASGDVARRHADWLAHGINVVTACKIACGGPMQDAVALIAAAREGGTSYGDSATVGAGLPVLRTIRELRRGGDQILGVSGVLSGSLAWLLDRYDGTQTIGALVEAARRLGYTEPDPRADLSGEDVRRKLLILVRAAGAALEEHQVEVEPLPIDDGCLRRTLALARREGGVLRYVARWDARQARVGVEVLAGNDPLAGGNGCDNRVAIRSSRYCDSPIVLQGPGAGPAVTAAALLDDVLRIAARP